MITFATSAFWVSDPSVITIFSWQLTVLLQHGIAGGYYLTFLFGGFVQTVARLCREEERAFWRLRGDDDGHVRVGGVGDGVEEAACGERGCRSEC